ncbi:MAG: phycobiliprotein lyase [Microcoleaceae cyanobacterium]
MIRPVQSLQLDTASAIADFFQQSEGQWHSERRYYNLPDGKPQEYVSRLTVRFLPSGSSELIELAQLHQFSDETILTCGSAIEWESANIHAQKGKPSQGSTIFGVFNDILYRDRGFATTDPITAKFKMLGSDTLCLRTEYNSSVFEEEIKHIGDRYRTRQSIISRAGEQKMIGQYLEKRIQ